MLLLPALRSRPALLDRARNLATHPHRWPAQPRFDPDRRWYSRISAEPDAEAWLLTWLPGQSTSWHDHGGSAGAVAIVAGALTEEVWRPGGPTRRVLAPDEGRGFGAHHVHRLVNAGGEPAISVHVYAPALTEMRRYELTGDVLRPVAWERAGVDW
ncbi:MAG TPA: cysteine dioxygenase family protein [Catenuloplanes sp.]